ncbi:MAG: hypothetical protein J6C90_00815 [Clostridia bacterium]|nr:hypothetical protein [Clostridia bacterium]
MEDNHQVNVQKNNRKKGSTAILVLSILLGLSVALGITGAFFTATRNATGTITLGDPVDISISQGGTNVTTLDFDGVAYPGTTYSAPISITAAANTSEACLRAKVTLTNTDSAAINVTATTNANWVQGDDDYYYYNGTINAGNTVEFIQSITVPTTLTNEDANKTYSVAIVCEAIQKANGAASATWTTAPTEWKTNYGA